MSPLACVDAQAGVRPARAAPCPSLPNAAPRRGDLYGLMNTFFGADGRGQLSLATFRTFVADLREELLRLEFQYYDWRKQVGACRAGCRGATGPAPSGHSRLLTSGNRQSDSG